MPPRRASVKKAQRTGTARTRSATAQVKPAAPKKAEVKITAAKGRPMLTWVGKRPLSHVTAFPAQHIETFSPPHTVPLPSVGEGAGEGRWNDWPAAYPKGGLLFHGDNKEVLAHLLANGFRGKVNLIYIDPPFDSGADYVRRVSLRGAKGTAKLDGESYTLGEQIQYTDIWANDNYLQFMYERLMLLKELLAPIGFLFLHCNTDRSHYLSLRPTIFLDTELGHNARFKEVSLAKQKPERGRFSSRKKMDAVLRLLRGEELDVLSRELGVTAATVSGWRDAVVAAGHASLKSRRPNARDEEVTRLKAAIGDLTMRNEVLREGLRRVQEALPLAWRRSAS